MLEIRKGCLGRRFVHSLIVLSSGISLVVGCSRWALSGAGASGGSSLSIISQSSPEKADEQRLLLSARFTAAKKVVYGEADELLLVFSTKLAPTTVERKSIVVQRRDGERVYPEQVTLWPANELDEGHSLLLWGDFASSANQQKPLSVLIVGSLYGQKGESIEGSRVQVEGDETPIRVVWTERFVAKQETEASGFDVSRCSGTRSGLRLHWSARLGSSSKDALQKIWVSDGQREIKASRIEELDDAEARDNIMDLCFDKDFGPTETPRFLHVQAGTVLADDGSSNRAMTVNLLTHQGGGSKR